MSRSTIGAMLIVRNEERHLVECLDALDWCDEIAITVDALSTDATADIARRYTDNVVSHELISLPNQRTLTLDRLHTDWVWVMDADERMTPELRSEIERTVANPGRKVAFWVPRKNLVLGKWIRHAGWYPDYQTRLLRVGQAQYDRERTVHEVVKLYGAEGTLRNPIIHYNYRDLAHFNAKQENYANYEAQRLFAQGVRPRRHSFILQPLRQFHWRFVTLRGYHDRWHGLRLSLLMARYEYRKFKLLQALWRNR